MGIENTLDLLHALLAATKPSEVDAILAAIGDGPAVGVDRPFGDAGYRWRFFDDNPSNMSTINLGSKPGRSLTERVTNAIDALLESEMYHQGDPALPPKSPMDAAEAWFGRPPTSANSGLYGMSPQRLAANSRRIHVVMTPGDERSHPTVDISDDGIGIPPEHFPNTILSFHRGNKISKRYLAGAFGQGGSATIAFADYTLIVSRHVESGRVVGFTLVKLMELEDDYKENAYVFLVVPDGAGGLRVPCVDIEGALDLYPKVKDGAKKPPPLQTGTAVRHFGYQLEGLERPLSSSPRNLLHLFQHTLFDPLLPFRVVDLRSPGHYRNEIVIGSRNRLMLEDSPEVEIRHHQPRFWIRPTNGEAQSLGIEYWVVFADRQNGQKAGQRVRPHDLFLDPSHPLIGTLNGQNHGELTARIIREAGLSQVSKHIIVHFDLTYVRKKIRSQMLSSTREGFKDGDVLNEVMRLLQEHFRDDEILFEIETELEERLIQSEEDQASKEVKTGITKLLRDVGLDFTGYGGVFMPGEVIELRRKSTQKPVTGTLSAGNTANNRAKRQVLETLPYPQAHRLQIVRPKNKLRIHQNDSRFVKVETDADSRFDKHGALQIRVVPNHLIDVSKGSLVGGRINWRLRPVRESKVGDIGNIIITLSLPDGRKIEDRLPYEILPPREQKIKTARGPVPAFDVQGVDPLENPDLFFRIWDTLDPEEDDITTVAYRMIETSGGLVVYYSKAFSAYRKIIEDVKQKRPALVRQFVQNYEIWIGYYAILQWQQHALDGDYSSTFVDEAAMERLQDNERAIVAEMQVKQAMETAQLQEYARTTAE